MDKFSDPCGHLKRATHVEGGGDNIPLEKTVAFAKSNCGFRDMGVSCGNHDKSMLLLYFPAMRDERHR